jgi:septal ring factor EnvC (AmiA/AmiB activator)
MNAPFLSRPADPDKLRREIATLESEINLARARRDNVIRAISDRRLKLNRLKAQLALCDSAPALSTAQLCPA